MAFQFSPKVVTNGLLLSLDVANPDSYPGSDFNWYDTSGNGNHFYLYNTPTFVNSQIKSFNFDGLNQYARWIGPFGYSTNKDFIKNRFIGTNRNLNWAPNQDRTIEIWCALNGTSGGAVPYNWGGLIGDQKNRNGVFYVFPGNHPVWTWNDSTDTNPTAWTAKNPQVGEWMQLVVVLRASYFFTYYVNGFLDRPEQLCNPIITDPGFGSNQNWTIARENRPEFLYYLACNVAIVRMYNRTLSAQEILQNYNAAKNRFNLP